MAGGRAPEGWAGGGTGAGRAAAEGRARRLTRSAFHGPAPADASDYFFIGYTGSTGRPAVAFITPANEVYQARAAVMMPSQPPM